MIDRGALGAALVAYLPRQRWFSGDVLDGVTVRELELVRTDWPALAWALVDADVGGGRTATYQVLVGLRPIDGELRVLEGKDAAVIGELDTERGPAVAYDGLVDPELALAVLAHIAPDEKAERARPLAVEQTNTSVVYDERLFLKVFRRVASGPNPDAEVTAALAGEGFAHVTPPVARWQRGHTDLAVVTEYLVGGAEGWQLALTSLRDLYDRRCPPGDCGGDFAPEAARLGEVTGEMHVALGRAFGVAPATPDAWADELGVDLGRVEHAELDRAAVGAALDRLRGVADAGAAIRIHGDFHLGQTMRADTGWYVLDFEGEPARPLEERTRPSSPLRDVAGLLRSFQYASRVALAEQGADADEELLELGRVWERHNRDAFLAGYARAAGIAELLPGDEHDRAAVLTAFELGKAVYEVGYELSHRPAWVAIPLEAVDRLARGAS